MTTDPAAPSVPAARPAGASAPLPSPGRSLVLRWSNLTPLGILVTRSEIVLAGLFLFAAYHKLWDKNDPQNFAASVQAFKVPGMTNFSTRLTTGVVPWVEVVASVLLILGIWSRAAAGVLSLMLVAFIVLITNAILNGYDLECGCFGDLSPFCPKRVGWCNVIQNAILLGLGLIVALTPREKLARSARMA